MARKWLNIRTGVDEFHSDDFFNLTFTGVHDSDPLHGICGFQRFCRTGRCSKCRENGIQPFLCRSVCFVQVIVQCSGQDHSGVQTGTVFFKVCFAEPAVQSKRFLLAFRDFPIRDEVVSFFAVLDGRLYDKDYV